MHTEYKHKTLAKKKYVSLFTSDAMMVLIFGLAVTATLMFITYDHLRKNIQQEVQMETRDLQIKFESRLKAQTQILRDIVALFIVSDTITREEFRDYYHHSRISTYFPGIQGIGYSKFIAPGDLEQHIEVVRKSGFPDYTITPDHQRDKYSSILYLEPFEDRNLRAFGFDMFSEPVRRKAMQEAMDSNYAAISGKVILVQETENDIQHGFLIYTPIYYKGMPLNTVEERRAAIRGWIYSPYRIKDLTEGIFKQWHMSGLPDVRFKLYDGEIVTPENLLYESHEGLHPSYRGVVYTEILPVRLNNTAWTLVASNEPALLILDPTVLLVFFSGIIISTLLFLLSSALINARIRTTEIQQLNIELEKVNTDKDRFISILSHDLKNPFNSMLGFLDILSKDLHTLEKDKIERFIHYLHDITRNTYRLLEDLLEWARIQTGKFQFEPVCFRFLSAYQDVYGQLYAHARAKGITISCDIPHDLVVIADQEMVKTILRNLISNAIKFSHPGGEVKVLALSNSLQATVCVSDQGVGMDEKRKNSLFNITQTVTSRGTHNESGTGLGLLLCREFVKIHGSDISIESQPDKGSNFCFDLPIEQNFKLPVTPIETTP
jgi:signal transduction histidine kinase